ncbi:MAG TPA: hypothetical protein VI215_02145 [Bacteroidota bacterium]|jgi:hypothetical protein
MNPEEIRKLIPFFVAGTLDPEERKIVEEELRRSPELEDEVKYWRNARRALLSEEEQAREEHLTPANIIDYIEEKLSGDHFATVERHLSRCESCNEDVKAIRDTYGTEARPIPGARTGDGILEILRSVRLSYVLPAIAAATLAVFLIVKHYSPRQADHLRIVLGYQPQLRGPEEQVISRFVIGQDTRFVNFVLAVPHTAIASTRYAAWLANPDGLDRLLAKELQPAVVTANEDTVKVSVGMEVFPRDGIYSLSISEMAESLPPGAEPQEYLFRFSLSKSGE